MDYDLKYLYDAFQSCLSQNERIAFFEDSNNRKLMQQFDINIENLYDHHIKIFEKTFKTSWYRKDIS